MNCSLVLFLASIMLAIVSASQQKSDLSSQFVDVEFDSEQGWKFPKDFIRAQAAAKNTVRAHRFPSKETCGKKLVMFVLSICGESCDPRQGHDIATLCCHQQCTEEFVRSACCPSSM